MKDKLLDKGFSFSVIKKIPRGNVLSFLLRCFVIFTLLFGVGTYAFPQNLAIAQYQTSQNFSGGQSSELSSPVESSTQSTSQTSPPSWIKNSAKWWSEGKISDAQFVQSIQYMIQKGIIQIPTTRLSSSSNTEKQIPSWVKNTAGWWASGQVSDDQFVKSIQYLVSQNVISTVSTLPLQKLTSVKFLGTLNLREIHQSTTVTKLKEVEHPFQPSVQLLEFYKKKYQSIISHPNVAKMIQLNLNAKNKTASSSNGDPTIPTLMFNGLSISDGVPDVSIATGPNYVVEVINLQLGIFNKQYGTGYSYDLGSIFQAASNYDNQFTPFSDTKVIYDSTSGHFFVSVMGGIEPGNIYPIGVLVSATSDPTGAWYFYSINFPRTFDQPKIGTSSDKFVVGTIDTSPNSNGDFMQEVLDKNQMENGNLNPDHTDLFSMDTVTTGNVYVVSTTMNDLFEVVKIPNNNVIQLYTITGLPSSASLQESFSYNIGQGIEPVPSGIQPPTSSLSGNPTGNSNVEIDTGDDRILSAVWSQTFYNSSVGQIWLSFNDGCIPAGDNNAESCIRLVQINPTNPICGISGCGAHQDIMASQANFGYYYPALALDSSNNLTVVFGYSSANIDPSLAIVGQAATDTLDSLDDPMHPVSGFSSHYAGSYFLGRYGDYFGASSDPSDTSSVWLAGEYPLDIGNDGTMIIEAKTASTMPTSVPIPAPAAIYCAPNNPDQNGNLDLLSGKSGTITCTVSPKNGFSGTITLYKHESMDASLTSSTNIVSVASCTQPCTPQTSTVQLTVNPYTSTWYQVALTGTAITPVGTLTINSNPVTVQVSNKLPILIPLHHLNVKYITSWNGPNIPNNSMISLPGNNGFSRPTGIAISGLSIYIADTGNNRIDKFTLAGNFLKYWDGTTSISNGGFTQQKGVKLNTPTALAIDPSGNILVADTGNNCIQKFDVNGNPLVSQGNGIFSFNFGPLFNCGYVGSISKPNGVAVDSEGNVYVDSNVDTISIFNANGYRTTSGGTDGLASGEEIAPGNTNGLLAYIWQPSGLAVDSTFNIYTDYTNSIEKGSNISQDCSLSFLVNTNGMCFGDIVTSTPFSFLGAHAFSSIALDSHNHVFVVDTANNAILVFDTSGNFVGWWGSAGSGIGQFSKPTGIAVDSFGFIYVVDTGNNRVEKFQLNP